jgi:hypothetical protein
MSIILHTMMVTPAGDTVLAPVRVKLLTPETVAAAQAGQRPRKSSSRRSAL